MRPARPRITKYPQTRTAGLGGFFGTDYSSSAGVLCSIISLLACLYALRTSVSRYSRTVPFMGWAISRYLPSLVRLLGVYRDDLPPVKEEKLAAKQEEKQE